MNKREGLPKVKLNKIRLSEANVRKLNKKEKIDELAESIKKYDLLQPVVVYERGGRFELIIGQRRLLAFKELSTIYLRKIGRPLALKGSRGK